MDPIAHRARAWGGLGPLVLTRLGVAARRAPSQLGNLSLGPMHPPCSWVSVEGWGLCRSLARWVAGLLASTVA